MNKDQYREACEKINVFFTNNENNKKVFLFGHCNATLEIVDLLIGKNISPVAILDNSEVKQGKEYKGVPVCSPSQIIGLAGDDPKENSIVFITSRFYESMFRQLRGLGYNGPIKKLIDYNTFANYSLSEETVSRMKMRERLGEEYIKKLDTKYPNHFRVYFPFNALGDVYFAMTYWESFAKTRNIDKVIFCAPSETLREVVQMFGDYLVEVYEQKELDAMIQAAIYTQDENSFIAHQDRPYVVNLSKALYVKKIPLEKIYCCGVYGLQNDTVAAKPNTNTAIYKDIESIPEGKSVIFSPYAKSVVTLDQKVWDDAVSYYGGIGYKCFTNVTGDEKPLKGTEPISPSITEIGAVVERAGTFVGIRSGLCDILREVKAKKIALYPDYYYCDTKWKAIEMYWIDQFEHNLLATEEIKWETL